MSIGTTPGSAGKPYDVALSFADEDRHYVRQVANHLKAAGVRVFYDEFEKARLWGENLIDLLDDIYQHDAKYVVAFVSRHYAEKVWTTHERRSAQAQAIEQTRPYLLPARFDDTDLPGLYPTTGYIDLRQLEPRDLADLIREKIGVVGAAEGEGQASIRWDPDNPPLPSLITDVKPPGWEYMLIAAYLLRGVQRLAHKRRSFDLGFGSVSGRQLSGEEAISVLQGELTAAERMVDPINRVLADCLTPAAGPHGEAGNEQMIEECTTHLLSIYESFFDWARRVRSYNVPDYLVEAVEAEARIIGGAISSFEEFVREVADFVSRLPALVEESETKGPTRIDLTWTVRADDRAAADFNRAIKRAGRRARWGF